MVSTKAVNLKKIIPKKVKKLAKVEKPQKKKPIKDMNLMKVEKLQKLKPVKAIKTITLKEKKIEVLPKTNNEAGNKKKNKYVMPSKYISEEHINSCLNALELLGVHYKKKNTIFEDESPIFAVIDCIKIQKKRGNIKFVLPNSTVASTGEVCLITPDLKKGRKVDHESTVDLWEEKLKNAGITSVKTVLPMRQLRVEYDQYELKRRLMTQHDFIMVDTRVLNHVSHLLGKMFFKKHNMVIPVRLNDKGSLKKDIDDGLRTAMLRLSEGATSTIILGHTGMPQNAVKENILSFIKQLRDRYPGGEANIRSISLKLPLSLALPLYLTLRPNNTISAPKLKHKKPKHFTVLEDELSTIPGSTVRVAPDGTVHLKKSEVPESDVEEDMEDNESTEEKEESDIDDK